MDTERQKAGALILRDLDLFNRAALFMEEIEDVVGAEVDQLFANWAEARGWESGGGLGGAVRGKKDDPLWVSLRQWYDGDGDAWRVWFEFHRPPGHGSNSYLSADLFGVGQATFGIRFQVSHCYFGGKSEWNAFTKSLTDLAARLGARGWAHEGKGVFARPVVLDAGLLADAWVQEDWTAALAPLEAALDALAEDLPLFEDLVARAAAGRA